MEAIGTYLPEDLQREIFEVAARSSVADALILIRVAKYVRFWIEPLLYEVTTFNPGCPPTLYKKHGHSIRHLLIDDTSQDIFPYLGLCPNVQDLALWNNPFSNPTRLLILDDLSPQLKRLSIHFNYLFSSNDDFQQRAKFPAPTQAPLFPNLTHLEVVHGCDNWEDWDGLARLPQLTHISFFDAVRKTNVVQGVLDHCPHIRVLALVCGHQTWGPIPNATLLSYEHPDARVVHFACDFAKDWENGAKGLRDMWAIADEVVANRRRVGSRDVEDAPASFPPTI